MALTGNGRIAIPGAAKTAFDHGAFDAKTRRVFVARTGGDSLLLNDWAQVVAGYAVGKTGIAVDPLDAYQVAAKFCAGQDPCRAASSRRRQPRSQAGHTSADNHNVVLV